MNKTINNKAMCQNYTLVIIIKARLNEL